MRIDVLTTFPELFSTQSPGVLGVSIPKRVIDAGLLSVHATDIRDHTTNKHLKTDDRPFGGGPGMVMMCQPVWDAVTAVESQDPTPARRILLTPQGVPLTQALVEELAQQPRLLMIAGHYEGIDERVIEKLDPLEISLGDYVLSGGELGALVLIDAIARMQPGALGHADSAAEDSFSQAQTTNSEGQPIAKKILQSLNIPKGAKLLDCPHYTRPQVWEGIEIPKVLVSGDHDAVAKWRLEQRLQRTRQRRPDLLKNSDSNTLS
ncbi:MAG: tRNA (guanosine(37)-N1)-methyltransferase TrmD [Phycisphaerae bacterium]|nr:tRNA (guanosine(37)-N1)-methyltransferase TrmD [Phycisphaerae bacterium]MBM91419.1 tRNA (guanosine(37)-N1)-methyltransferase TrmD [Phycisphaerae bacterium]MBM92713.1 tRNA (guanosine(37)-N1)-methyltransferase TrmD [Phycisphaerae bacterium]HCT44636.1 tRNA (guanosine(37)-N1)-methyltransferase TrmD [Phycisphaerales bacterium]|tara:strand:+ start:264 stop:1052 length:789 start_codon:yes stop_codon:yes gene_type:complete